MKLPNINKRHLAAAMLAIAALMLLDSLYQVGMHIRWRYWIPASLAVEIPSTQPACSQPAGSQPSSQPATQPASQPAATQSSSSQPSSTEAAGSQAAATQTVSSQPSTTRAAGSQAATSQSGSTQPSARASASQKSGNSPGTPPGAAAAKPPKAHELAAAIKKRNIMAEPKPTGHGLSLAGVLDNVAFFRNREGKDVFIEEGKSGDGGVKVKTIDGTDVTIEYEGKPETMKLFSK